MSLLAKLTSVRIKLVCVQVINSLLGGAIDVRPFLFYFKVYFLCILLYFTLFYVILCHFHRLFTDTRPFAVPQGPQACLCRQV